MGWPHSDPEGWDEVCRQAAIRHAAESWLTLFQPVDDDHRVNMTQVVEWLYAAFPAAYTALLAATPNDYILEAEADYFADRVAALDSL